MVYSRGIAERPRLCVFWRIIVVIPYKQFYKCNEALCSTEFSVRLSRSCYMSIISVKIYRVDRIARKHSIMYCGDVCCTNDDDDDDDERRRRRTVTKGDEGGRVCGYSQRRDCKTRERFNETDGDADNFPGYWILMGRDI